MRVLKLQNGVFFLCRCGDGCCSAARNCHGYRSSHQPRTTSTIHGGKIIILQHKNWLFRHHVSSPEYLFTAGRSVSRATSTELLHWKLQSLGPHDHHSTWTVRAFRSFLLGCFTIVLLILAVFRYLSSVLWVEPVARILSLPATDLCTTANLRCVKIAIEYQNFWKDVFMFCQICLEDCRMHCLSCSTLSYRVGY